VRGTSKDVARVRIAASLSYIADQRDKWAHRALRLFVKGQGFRMRHILTVSAAAVALLGASPVFAKGCIRGAVAGAVAGHYVGKGHAVLGATAGCVATHHYYAKKAAQQKAAARVQTRRPIRR
jgi:hypothetical protein